MAGRLPDHHHGIRLSLGGLEAQGSVAPREPDPAIGKRRMMSSPSDADVIGRSLGEPEAFGLIYDRHAAALLRFLRRRAGAKVAEGLLGELFGIAFDRRKNLEQWLASPVARLHGLASD